MSHAQFQRAVLAVPIGYSIWCVVIAAILRVVG